MPPDNRGDGIGVEELRAATDIVEVVRQHVPSLQKAGREWKGLCPFHSERTPSFYVIPRQARYYCFGCKAAGDAIRFVQETDRVGFAEACDRLARRIGRRFYGRESVESRTRRDLILDANGEASRLWADILWRSERAAEARAYVERRGISRTEAEEFGLGFSLPEWDALGATLRGRGKTEELLLEAGLVIAREGRDGSYDRFRGRLMFPIRSSQGDTIAFGGRALGDEQPKYLNSPTTPVFDKSRTFYGFPHASDGMRAEGWALVVEGYTDVLACHRAGVRNAVATLGTALTPQHLAVLRRHVEKVVVAYDSDSAGLSAMLRAAEELENSPLEVAAIVLPPGEDPDSLLRARGAEALRAAVESAEPLRQFVLDRILPPDGGAPDRRAVRAAVEAIARVTSPLARERYVAYAAERLAHGDATRMNAAESALRREVAGAVRDQARRGRTSGTAEGASTEESVSEALWEAAATEAAPGAVRREAVVLAAIAQETVAAGEVFPRLPTHLFHDPVHQDLARRIADFAERSVSPADASFAEGLSAEAVERWSRLSVADTRTKEAVEDCVSQMLDAPKHERLAQLRREYPALIAKPVRTEEEEQSLLELQELLRYFSSRAGRRSAVR